MFYACRDMRRQRFRVFETAMCIVKVSANGGISIENWRKEDDHNGAIFARISISNVRNSV